MNFSPSTSLEAVGAPTAGQGTIPAPRQWVDSDDEAGDCIADWSSNVAADILQTLSDAEKKRQEIINGKILRPTQPLSLIAKFFVSNFQKYIKRNGITYEHYGSWKVFLCVPSRSRVH